MLNSMLGNEKFIQVAGGRNHTLLLSYNGKVYSCGENRFGQLGHSKTIIFANKTPIAKMPFLIRALENHRIVKVACGAYFSFFLNDTGEVFFCGAGRGAISDQFVPIQLDLKNKKIIDIVCGSDHAILLTDQGETYSCGTNLLGSAGQDNADNLQIPKPIPSLSNKRVVQISCGEDFSVFRTDRNEIYGCGRNYSGQLGLGNNIDQKIPVLVTSVSDKKIIHIVCGIGNVYFISDNGEIYATGLNHSGQLGVGDRKKRDVATIIQPFTEDKIINIACGANYTLFWSNKFMYMSGENKLSAFKFLHDQEQYILTPTLIRNPVLHEDQIVSNKFSGSRPWDID